MLSYANDYPEFAEQLSEVDEELITYDFLAKRFIHETKKLVKRGIVRDYVTHKEETGTISGKMLMNESLSFIVQRKPIVVCEKDEYSSNILLNQIMVKTLKSLYQNPYVEERTRKACFMLWEQLPGVEDINLTREVFLRVKFSRHNVFYKSMVHLARLLYELRLLSHRQGDWSLFTVNMEEWEMNRLFEKFLFHFYRIEQREYRVSSERMTWNLERNKSLLPTMLTDISLTNRSEKKKIVMDAKFYKNMFQRLHDKHSFHSHNLYQIFAYLMHQPKDYDVRGMLIYPTNNEAEIHEHYEWDERMKLEICSINLDESWQMIRGRLIGML